jgi:hypothetical protein
MISLYLKIQNRIYVLTLNSFGLFICLFMFNLLLISSVKQIIAYYRKSRIKKKIIIESENVAVWDKRGGDDNILTCVPDSEAVYELTNPGLIIFIKKFLRKYALKQNWAQDILVITREVFFYAMIKYNSGIQVVLTEGFGLELANIGRVVLLSSSSLILSSLLMFKYKILLKYLHYKTMMLTFLIMLGYGIKLEVCLPDCLNFIYSKQVYQHQLMLPKTTQTVTKTIVKLYDNPVLVKHKLFISDLPEKEIQFILLKAQEPTIKNRIFTKINKKIPLSHRTQTIDGMNKKELKKLANRDFCQLLPEYEKEKIDAEHIKND